MRKGLTFFISIFPFLSTAFTAHAQTVEFYTPRTVRIVKDNGQNVEKKSLVVVASPEQVKVSQTKQGAATVYKSAALTVTVDNGKVTLLTAGATFSPVRATVPSPPSRRVPTRVLSV